MKELFFEDDIDDSKYCGHLYGLGTQFSMGLSLTTSKSFNGLGHRGGLLSRSVCDNISPLSA